MSTMKPAFAYPELSSLCEKSLSFMREELISEKYRKKLLSFTQLLPQKLNFSNFGFECPLYGEENWGDILFHIDLLKETSIQDLSILPEPWQQCSGWNRLSKFSRECIEKKLFSGDLHEIDPKIWIEFDVGSSSVSPYKPSIWLHTSKIRKSALHKTLQNCASFFEIPTPTLELIRKYSDSLIGSTHIAEMGFMLSRPVNNAVKLEIRGRELSYITIPEYLSLLGISDIPASLTHVLKNMAPIVDGTALEVGIEDGKVSSKIGLQFSISPHQHERELLWQRCFDILGLDGEINQKKRVASLDWYGHDLEYIGNSVLPPYFLLSALRTISHVKLTFTPGQETRAKIYFETRLAILKKESSSIEKFRPNF